MRCKNFIFAKGFCKVLLNIRGLSQFLTDLVPVPTEDLEQGQELVKSSRVLQ